MVITSRLCIIVQWNLDQDRELANPISWITGGVFTVHEGLNGMVRPVSLILLPLPGSTKTRPTNRVITDVILLRRLLRSVTNSPSGYLSLPFFSFLLIGAVSSRLFPLRSLVFFDRSFFSSRSFLCLDPWFPLGGFCFLLFFMAPLDFQISIVRGECHSFFNCVLFEFFFGSPYRFCAQPIMLILTVSAKSIPQLRWWASVSSDGGQGGPGFGVHPGWGSSVPSETHIYCIVHSLLWFPPICGRLIDLFHPCSLGGFYKGPV